MPWPSWPPVHTAGSCSASCRPTPQGPFLPDIFPATLPQACSIARGCCDRSAGLGTWHCWSSYSWPRPINPACPVPSAERSYPPAQCGVICRLTEGALIPLIQIIGKDVEQDRTQNWALRDTTRDRLPAGFNSIHHHSLRLDSQSVLYPAESTPIQTMGSQFLQEDAVGNSVKCLTKVQVDDIHNICFVTRWVTWS